MAKILCKQINRCCVKNIQFISKRLVLNIILEIKNINNSSLSEIIEMFVISNYNYLKN